MHASSSWSKKVRRRPGSSVVRGSRRQAELAARGVKIIGVADDDGRLSLPAAMDALGQHDIVSLLVEGGPTLHGAFFDHSS